MKNTAIEIETLEAWMIEAECLFASQSDGKNIKQLKVTLYKLFRVYHNRMLLLETNCPTKALALYNEIEL